VRYIPSEYWFERGKKYKDEFRPNIYAQLQERILLDYLKNISVSFSSFSTILEVGCGFGRLVKLLLSNFPNILEYIAIDLSPHQIDNAKEFVKPVIESLEHNPLNFIVSDIQSFQSERKYDLVISAEVLMHILPSEIEEVMTKIVDMSNEHIINIDWYEKKLPWNAAAHNFIHQYEMIYRNMPAVSNVYRIPIVKRESWFRSLNTKKSIFHACKKH
jgi:cyclopropane fatty-acyl-phospholipid synthase-like methyltransferase